MNEKYVNIVAASIGKGKGQISSITLAASRTLPLSPFTKIDMGLFINYLGLMPWGLWTENIILHFL